MRWFAAYRFSELINMTQKDIKQFLEKRTGGSLEQTVTTEEGLEAIEILTEVAEANGVDFIIAGGLAVQLYGFTRATTDADVLASAVLPIESFRQLSFGGESYKVQISNGKTVIVDWIVRADEKKDVYEASISQPEQLSEKLKIVSPEWLVIIKQLAGRGKDELDLLWLLRKEGLVDRKKVKELVRQVFGRFAFVLIEDLEANFLYADVMKAKDEKGE
jgi:hypothetical protein